MGHVNLTTNFDAELSEKILECCPKLKKFDIIYYDDELEFYNVVKVRPLLTKMQTPYSGDIDNAAQFVTQFPRLQSISCQDKQLSSLDAVFPILEQLSDVNNVHIVLRNDTEENFEEMHVPAQRKDLLINKLSNITDLSFDVHRDIANTLKLVPEYFTGLNHFKIEGDLYDWESNARLDLFCRNIFNALPTIKSYCSVELNYLQYTSLSRTFSSLVEIMFQNIPPIRKQANNRVLKLTLTGRDLLYGTHAVSLSLDSSVQSPFSRKIHISMDKYNFDTIASYLFQNDVPMDEVDVFQLYFTEKNKPFVINTQDYFELLATMPSLKQVRFDVPYNSVETELKNYRLYTGPVLSQVEEVTLSGISYGSMQSLLNDCCFAFPNLKRLNICSYSGLWKAFMGEFLLDLPDYCLEKLTVDVEPVMVQLCNIKDGFLVLEMEIENRSERLLYKISPKLSCSKIISSCDLKGLKRREDYVRMRLTVSNLKQVELCMYYCDTITRSCLIMLDDNNSD